MNEHMDNYRAASKANLPAMVQNKNRVMCGKTRCIAQDKELYSKNATSRFFFFPQALPGCEEPPECRQGMRRREKILE